MKKQEDWFINVDFDEEEDYEDEDFDEEDYDDEDLDDEDLDKRDLDDEDTDEEDGDVCLKRKKMLEIDEEVESYIIRAKTLRSFLDELWHRKLLVPDSVGGANDPTPAERTRVMNFYAREAKKMLDSCDKKVGELLREKQR